MNRRRRRGTGRRSSNSAENREEHLEALTKKELLELAAEVELEGAYAMNKAELIEALSGVPVSR